MDLNAYFAVFVFLVISAGLGIAFIMIGHWFGPRRPYFQKLSPYECGFETFDDARMKFDVRYYLLAILFILFDLETAFLIPWGVAFDQIGLPGFFAMLFFIVELGIGFIYLWKRGALDWE